MREQRCEAGPERVSLLELYTSEGCSSCPPAESWLTGFKEMAGYTLFGAFHVDYWDNLGWKDRLPNRNTPPDSGSNSDP